MIIASRAVIATSAAADAYWFGTYGGANNEQDGTGAFIDAADSGYMAMRTDSAGAGNTDLAWFKVDKTGALQLQRTLGTGNYDNGTGIAVATNGNIYLAGQFGNPTYADAVLAKYNSSGTIQWQRYIDVPGSVSLSVYSCGLDSSENAYLYAHDGTANSLYVAKFNSSGTIQWQRLLDGANVEVTFGGHVTASGDVYVTGYTRSGGAYTNNSQYLAKYNTSGTLQWQTYLYPSSGLAEGRDIAVDASGNVYVVGYSTRDNPQRS